jgi:hypothetical protein
MIKARDSIRVNGTSDIVVFAPLISNSVFFLRKELPVTDEDAS